VTTITLVESDKSAQVAVTPMGGDYWISAADISTVLGWEVKPEGLCKDRTCIPLVNRADLVDGDTISLTRLAELIARPLAISLTDHAVYLGPPLVGYEESVGHLDAPDFVLPDLDGQMHSLSEHRGSKVLLAAWASW
jgi:hypothetical protein